MNSWWIFVFQVSVYFIIIILLSFHVLIRYIFSYIYIYSYVYRSKKVNIVHIGDPPESPVVCPPDRNAAKRFL